MFKILGVLRLLLFILLTIFYVSFVWFYAFFVKANTVQSLMPRKVYVHLVIWLLGIKIKVKNLPKENVFILMSNHRSYLDPVVMAKDIPLFALAKSEVSKWPIIGLGARYSGGFFVKREEKNSREAAAQRIVELAKEDKIVFLCPEGTTHTEAQTIAFKPRTFYNAAKFGFTIIPAAIEYGKKDDAFVGSDLFIPHFINCFSKWHTKVLLSYGPPMKNDDSEILLNQCKTWIDAELKTHRKELGYID